MNIRPVELTDAAQVAEIYNYYIETSIATFELEPIDAAEMEKRIAEKLAGNYPFYIAEENGELAGYAHGAQFKPRAAYKNSIEVSVYVKNGHHGKGIATLLYEALFVELARRGFHTAIGGISLPNEASVKLHEKFGMVQVAHFKEVGFKFGKWIDTGYWQKLLI
jgi:L-amino acid N-acyltransferase YncA